MLRKFYRFIRGIDEKKVFPDEVKWISTIIPKRCALSPTLLDANKPRIPAPTHKIPAMNIGIGRP